MSQRTERCETCRFWVDCDDEDGICRRLPPVLPVMTEQVAQTDDRRLDPLRGLWPETVASDWCGEWRAKTLDAVDFASKRLADYEPKFSGQVINQLWCQRIETVGELLRYTARDVLSFRNIGGIRLEEICNKLDANGLYLRRGE